MKIFITGGTGFVGKAVVDALLQRGHSVRILVHRAKEKPRPGVELVEGDATRLETFGDSVKGCDAFIHLIGIIREFPGRGITFRKLHVEATRNALEAASNGGIGRYLHMSALGTRPGATSTYHRTKFEAEELVRASGLECTIFRPSLIFGEGDAFVNMLAGYIRSFHAVPVIGDGKYRLQPIAVEDVARCFADALEREETEEKTFELCGPDRLTYAQILDEIGDALGTGFIKLHSPLALMKAVVPLLEKVPAFPLTTDQMLMLVEENICDGNWQKTFGFNPLGFREGIRRYLQRN